jgi:hypothetical protein
MACRPIVVASGATSGTGTITAATAGYSNGVVSGPVALEFVAAIKATVTARAGTGATIKATLTARAGTGAAIKATVTTQAATGAAIKATVTARAGTVAVVGFDVIAVAFTVVEVIAVARVVVLAPLILARRVVTAVRSGRWIWLDKRVSQHVRDDVLLTHPLERPVQHPEVQIRPDVIDGPLVSGTLAPTSQGIYPVARRSRAIDGQVQPGHVRRTVRIP